RRTRDRPQLTLGRLDGGIYFASRNPVAFSVKLEVMNERLHRALHLGAARGHDLGINEMGRTLPVRRPQLGNTLFHDADRLAHLFHADAVAVVTIAVLADRDVEIQLRIALVRLGLAQVPGGAATGTITPEKPQAQASASETTPMSTLRCLKMRLSVSRPSISSHTFRNGSQNASISSISFGGRS